MVLVSVMTLVEHDHVNFFHFCESMHKKVVKLFRHRNKNIMGCKLLPPCIKLGVVFAISFLSSQIAAYIQICVTFYCRSLLFNQVLNWHNKENLFLPLRNRALMTRTIIALVSGS